MKRLARLTHAFSKKRENFEAAVGLHFAYYNFVRRHNILRCTPAMARGVEQTFWSVCYLVGDRITHIQELRDVNHPFARCENEAPGKRSGKGIVSGSNSMGWHRR